MLTQSIFKIAVGILLAMLLFLQYRLWVADGSVSHTTRLEDQLKLQQSTNAELEHRNNGLVSEIAALKNGMTQIEAKAREDLGLVKKDETFFMFVEDDASADSHALHSETADAVAYQR